MDEADKDETEAALPLSSAEALMRLGALELRGQLSPVDELTRLARLARLELARDASAPEGVIETPALGRSDGPDPVQSLYLEGWTMQPPPTPMIPPPYQVVMIGINGGVTERTFEDKSLMLSFVAALEGSPVRVRVYRGYRCNFKRDRSLQFQDGENNDVMTHTADDYEELDCANGV